MKSLRLLTIIGTSLVALGSFLPWESGGDFISYDIYGIGLFPALSDSGGTVVLLLSLMIVLLTFKPPRLIKNSGLWSLVISAVLMSVSLIFVARFYWIHRFESHSAIGAATLGTGLEVVMVGASLLLWSALMNYPQIFKRQT